MSTRAAIRELLAAGHSDRAIARQTHVRTIHVAAIRRQLGYPTHKPGPTPAGSVEDAFWRRAQPVDGGHLLWPGTEKGRAPRVKHDGIQVSVHQIAFRIATGREPVGKVRTGCDRPGCVHPRHVEDQQMRTTYTAIFGGMS